MSDEKELAILRAMSPGEKLAVARGLWQQAWDLTRAGVRHRHPGWTAEQLELETRAIFGRDNS